VAVERQAQATPASLVTNETREAVSGEVVVTPPTPGEGHTVDDRGAYQLEELDNVPLILRRPSLFEFRDLYPELARRRKEQADIKVELLVGPDGEVREVTIIEGAGPDFDQAARKAARRLRFGPAMRRGRAVAMRTYIVFNFRLDQ
jgi:TonB family protein